MKWLAITKNEKRKLPNNHGNKKIRKPIALWYHRTNSPTKNPTSSHPSQVSASRRAARQELCNKFNFIVSDLKFGSAPKNYQSHKSLLQRSYKLCYVSRNTKKKTIFFLLPLILFIQSVSFSTLLLKDVDWL